MVVGMVDPHPIVASVGVKRLQHSDIEVIVGVEKELCKKLNEAYIHQMLTRKPFFTLRYSMSLGVNLLDHPGENAIERGEYYSKSSQEYDAVVRAGLNINIALDLIANTINVPSNSQAAKAGLLPLTRGSM